MTETAQPESLAQCVKEIIDNEARASLRLAAARFQAVCEYHCEASASIDWLMSQGLDAGSEFVQKAQAMDQAQGDRAKLGVATEDEIFASAKALWSIARSAAETL